MPKQIAYDALAFQFLIGRLDTADSAASYEKKFAFQFLIGRLDTRLYKERGNC